MTLIKLWRKNIAASEMLKQAHDHLANAADTEAEAAETLRKANTALGEAVDTLHRVRLGPP